LGGSIIKVIKFRMVRWGKHVARIGEIGNAHSILVGKKIEGKRPRGRPRCRWEKYIRTDLREIWGEVAGWMHLAQDKDKWRVLVNTVMNLRVP
jgi:hypothetical protein